LSALCLLFTTCSSQTSNKYDRFKAGRMTYAGRRTKQRHHFQETKITVSPNLWHKRNNFLGNARTFHCYTQIKYIVFMLWKKCYEPVLTTRRLAAFSTQSIKLLRAQSGYWELIACSQHFNILHKFFSPPLIYVIIITITNSLHIVDVSLYGCNAVWTCR
jgi:hypothetical protein